MEFHSNILGPYNSTRNDIKDDYPLYNFYNKSNTIEICVRFTIVNNLLPYCFFFLNYSIFNYVKVSI